MTRLPGIVLFPSCRSASHCLISLPIVICPEASGGQEATLRLAIAWFPHRQSRKKVALRLPEE